MGELDRPFKQAHSIRALQSLLNNSGNSEDEVDTLHFLHIARIDSKVLPSRMDWQLDSGDGVRNSRGRGLRIMRATCDVPSFKT